MFKGNQDMESNLTPIGVSLAQRATGEVRTKMSRVDGLPMVLYSRDGILWCNSIESYDASIEALRRNMDERINPPWTTRMFPGPNSGVAH